MSPVLIKPDGNADLISPSSFTSSSDSTPTTSYADTQGSDCDQQEGIDGEEGNDIAIVGFSLRFPGEATSADEFWKILIEAKVTASEFPPERLNHDAFYSADPAAMGTVRNLISLLASRDY